MAMTAYDSSILGFPVESGALRTSMDLNSVGAPESVGVQEAFQVLNYNQQLIQLGDSKAGNLIVINSLFIAAAQSQSLQAGATVGHLLQGVYVLLACAAVLACLRAISTRAHPVASDRKDLIFYNDILARANASRYIRDFRAATPDFQLDSTLRRTFVLAEIAQKKFAAYGLAQRLTVWAAATWVASHVLSMLV